MNYDYYVYCNRDTYTITGEPALYFFFKYKKDQELIHDEHSLYMHMHIDTPILLLIVMTGT